MAETPEQIIARARRDFRTFLYLVWSFLGLPPPTPVQLDIAYYFQHGPRRKVIQAFRGVGKTWIFGAFICWRLWTEPDRKVLVISATKIHADNTAKFVKRLIAEMPLLAPLKPRQGQMDSAIMFDVGLAKTSKDPSVKSVGITGQITGSRADDILADDIESLNNSATEGGRERLAEQVKEFDAVLKPGGTITYLGTPQSAMSMYQKLPERGYDIRIWPARIPSDLTPYAGRLGTLIQRMINEGAKAGTPTDPKRFHELDLSEREASYGRSGFALQFMLDTSLNDALKFPLKLADLIVHDLDPRQAPTSFAWARTVPVEGVQVSGLPGDKFYRPMYISDQYSDYIAGVLSIDPSGRGEDETAYAVVKHLSGNLFVPAAGAVKGGYDDATLDELVGIAKRQSVKQIIVESNFGGGMFTKLLQAAFLRADYKVAIEEVNHSTQKEARIIDTLEPVLNSHRLIVDTSVIVSDWETASSAEYSLFWQMTRLTRERGALRRDDRLDALAMAVAYWLDVLGQSAKAQEEKLKQKLLDDELRKFSRYMGSITLNGEIVTKRRPNFNRLR